MLLVLLSGGASALLAAPQPPLTLGAKQALTSALLRSGASIGEINCVRRHLSRIKGGRLAAAAFPAQVVTLAVSMWSAMCRRISGQVRAWATQRR